MTTAELDRWLAKTPQQRLQQLLEQDYQLAPRLAQAIVADAEVCLIGAATSGRPGQHRVVLAARRASPSRPLAATPTTEVIWTLDAGAEDSEVLAAHGPSALRQVRLQRLVDEAHEQGGVPSQEDLARALMVTVRTIKRDCAVLRQQGVGLLTRGALHGVGRGQTHKAAIVGRWLRGETYEQIGRHTRHALSSIQRYVQTFVRVVYLHQQGRTDHEIALLLGLSETLLAQYQALYQRHDDPPSRARLADQLDRLLDRPRPTEASKGGA